MEGGEEKDMASSKGGAMALPAREEGDGGHGGAGGEKEDMEMGMREPFLRRRTMNTASQLAVVGADVSPIESLDYE